MRQFLTISSGFSNAHIVDNVVKFKVLKQAMREWTAHVGNNGFNLIDGGLNLFDLRFADDILIFTESRVEVGNVFAAVVEQLVSFQFRKNKCHYEGNRTSPHHCDHIWSDSRKVFCPVMLGKNGWVAC